MKLRKAVYWTIDEGFWSPRDQRFSWRQWDSFETEAEARKTIKGLLKGSPTYPLMLTKVEMLEAWNTEKPAWDTTNQEPQPTEDTQP